MPAYPARDSFPAIPLRARSLAIGAIIVAACVACVEHVPGYNEPLVVIHAGSLARPLRAALDSFTAHTAIPVVTISAGSVEAARRITELHDVPDVIALADEEVFPTLLVPRYVATYWTFARNRMVIAIAPQRADVKIDSTNWYRVLSAPGAEVGRSNPDLDPAGYRALMVLRLAEYAYHNPRITRAVLARSAPRNIRPKSSDLVALLETGALDYAFLYESSARAAGLKWIELPATMNLGSDSLAATYARAKVRIAGSARGDSIEVHGEKHRTARRRIGSSRSCFLRPGSTRWLLRGSTSSSRRSTVRRRSSACSPRRTHDGPLAPARRDRHRRSRGVAASPLPRCPDDRPRHPRRRWGTARPRR